jgi:hypothetical protein
MPTFEHEGFVIGLKRVEPCPYVGVGREIALHELEGFIADACTELGVQAERDEFIVLYHSALRPDTTSLVEVCRPCPPEQAIAELAGGEVVFTEARGAQTEYPRIAHAYDGLTLAAAEWRREIVGAARETARPDGSLEVAKTLAPSRS